MAFRADRFLNAAYEPRTARLDVPELKAWFDEDEEPTWLVRSLTANEIWQAKNAGARMDNAKALVDAIKGSSKNAKSAEFSKIFGFSDDTEVEVAIRQEMLTKGTVEPEIDVSVAVKIGNFNGVLFQRLTDKILELTGLGQVEQGKPQASTKRTAKSEARSN